MVDEPNFMQQQQSTTKAPSSGALTDINSTLQTIVYNLGNLIAAIRAVTTAVT